MFSFRTQRNSADTTKKRLTINGESLTICGERGGTVKQVLFCGFQRKRESTLAIRKICVFGEFCVRKQKLCVSMGGEGRLTFNV